MMSVWRHWRTRKVVVCRCYLSDHLAPTHLQWMFTSRTAPWWRWFNLTPWRKS